MVAARAKMGLSLNVLLHFLLLSDVFLMPLALAKKADINAEVASLYAAGCPLCLPLSIVCFSGEAFNQPNESAHQQKICV